MRMAKLLLLLSLPCTTVAAEFAPPYPEGRRSRINGYRVLHLAGSGEQMGRQHARLLGRDALRVLNAVILEGEGAGTRYEPLVRGAMVMERYLPREIRAELRALAEGIGARYEDVVALQLFGDVQRGQRCTSYAVFGPATATGEAIVGRNMDFWDHGASRYGALLIHFTPREGYPFMTTTWAGVINGWTAMNVHGIVVANNSAFGGKDSLHGLSTCFMVRKVAQFARTVEEGVEIVKRTPRACGTNLIIAGGNPPHAAVVEYDHEQVAVRWAEHGYVTSANSFRALGRVAPAGFPAPEQAVPWMEDDGGYGDYWLSRDDLLTRLILRNYGRIDESMNFAAADGVPIRSMNLHSALVFPSRLEFRVSMSRVPAVDHPYRRYRLTERGIVSAE